MLHDYDIFEKFSDSSTIWRACVFGQFEARRKVQELAEYSPNEFIAIDVKDGEPLPFGPARRNDQALIRKPSETHSLSCC